MVTSHYLCIIKCIPLNHWGRVTHICVSKLTIIGWDNGLSPAWRQAIIWTNEGILLIPTLGTNFSEILSEIHSFSFKKMHLKMSSAKWRLFLSRPQWVNSLRQRQNSCHFADDISDTFSWMEIVVFWFKFNCLFPWVLLTRCHHWFR